MLKDNHGKMPYLIRGKVKNLLITKMGLISKAKRPRKAIMMVKINGAIFINTWVKGLRALH